MGLFYRDFLLGKFRGFAKGIKTLHYPRYLYFLFMGYFYAITAAITWWLVYALDQRILEKISPTLFICINALFSIIVLSPLLLLKWNTLPSISSLDKTTLWFIVFSLIFSLLANFLIMFAIQHVGSSRAAIFEIAYPFFVVLFSIFLYQAQVNNYFILGSIFLFVGSAIIITKW